MLMVKFLLERCFMWGNSDEKIDIEMLKVQFCVIFPILPEDGKSEGEMVDILRNKRNFLLKNTPPNQ